MARLRSGLVLLGICCITAGWQGCYAKVDAAEASIKPENGTSPIQFRKGAETFKFQAEINRLMDILINSLYSNKDIFLRELISNAADALDKIRFMSIANQSELATGEDLGIKIWLDEASNVLSIRDTGVGMTRDELVANLGTVARSGTSAFLEQMQQGGDLSLIGQFGVGFYSVYLVADYVEVVTKHNNDSQWVWESRASGDYALSRDDVGEQLGRGTQINIHLKPTCLEYGQADKLRELVERYSEFISFPIALRVQKTVTRTVPVEPEKPAEKPVEKPAKEEKTKDDEAAQDEPADAEAEIDWSKVEAVEVGSMEEAEEMFKKQQEEAAAAAADVEDDDVIVEEEEEESDDTDAAPRTKEVTETVQEWEVLNAAQALWLRAPGEVSEDEYAKFYRSLSKDERGEALAHTHFRAEGDVEFKAILYVPKLAPGSEQYHDYYAKEARMKLYVRRVFISDTFKDLLPKWLSFLVGLVDSDSIPLNVSREMLQLHDGLKVIKKKLVRKALDLLRRLSDEERAGVAELKELDAAEAAAEAAEEETDADAETSARRSKARAAVEKYEAFWRGMSKAVKMGIIEEQANRKRMLPLLRFASTSSNGSLTTLEEYVSRSKTNQSVIYYIVGLTRAEAEQSPFVEELTSRGYEVITFSDPLDEYLMGHLTEYDGRDFVNVSKDDLRLPEEEGAKEKAKAQKKEFKSLTKWWKDLLLPEQPISGVRVSQRLTARPCVVVASKYGWSAQMERLSAAQALGAGGVESAKWQRGTRRLEINPAHPMILELRRMVANAPEDAGTKNRAMTLYELCAMDSGYMLDDTRGFGERVSLLLGKALGLKDLEEPAPPKSKLDDKKDEDKDAGAGSAENDDEDEDGPRTITMTSTVGEKELKDGKMTFTTGGNAAAESKDEL